MDERIPKALLDAEAAALCKRYRVAPEEARTALMTAFEAQPGLLDEIQARHPDEDVTRMRAYKDAVKAARKAVYYRLRQYRRPAPAPAEDANLAALMQSHVSTAERDQDAFHRALAELVEPPETVVDLGCGLQPLALGETRRAPMQRVRLYVAVDRDPEVIDTLQGAAPLVAPVRLTPVLSGVETLAWSEIEGAPTRYDLALMLKLIPVLHRQNREALPALAEVPAQRVLITGSVEALARRETIRAREDRVLKAFIALSGRRVLGALETPGEFGYLLV